MSTYKYTCYPKKHKIKACTKRKLITRRFYQNESKKQDYQSGSYLFKLMKIWTFVCNIKVLIVNCENDSFTIVYEIIQFLRVENF